MKPRCYQIQAGDCLWDDLHRDVGNVLGIAPTGTGKTFIMNNLAKRLMKKYRKVRIMSLTHDKTIIGQNANSMSRFWRGADVGIYSAGLNIRDTRSRIIYAGIQSVHRKAELFGKIGILFVDEAHMLSPNDGTMYQRFIGDLLIVNPKMKIVFLSATPYRLGQGHLIESPLVNHISFDYTETEKFMWFVEQGYLSRLVTKKAANEIDITEARIRGGEFNESDIQELSNTQENNIAVVEECLRYGSERHHWMIFAAGVEHGMALAQQLNAYGVSAVALHAESPDREEELKKFERGEYTAMVNVGLYTTGYDFPALDLIAVVRATQSTSLWVQMCGRGTRCLYADGYDLETQVGRLTAIKRSQKQNCLVLDFAGNTRRLGAINCPIIPKPRKKGDANEGEAPVKVCPECGSYQHTRAVTCIDCGYEFPPPEDVMTTAGEEDIMVEDSLEPNIERIQVMDVIYKRGKNRQGGSYCRVSFTTLAGTFYKFLHPGSAHISPRKKFEDYWWTCLTAQTGRRSNYPYPTGIDDAVLRADEELEVPDWIEVDLNTKYQEIVDLGFDD